MLKRRVTVTIVLLFLCVTSLLSQGPASPDSKRPYVASLIQVIANPNDFNGQPLKVIGFLGRGGALDRAVGLFVSEADGRNFIVPNSIDLHLDESKVKDLMGRYVALSGTYHAPAPRSGYNGFFDQITDIRPWNGGDTPK